MKVRWRLNWHVVVNRGRIWLRCCFLWWEYLWSRECAVFLRPSSIVFSFYGLAVFPPFVSCSSVIQPNVYENDYFGFNYTFMLILSHRSRYRSFLNWWIMISIKMTDKQARVWGVKYWYIHCFTASQVLRVAHDAFGVAPVAGIYTFVCSGVCFC